MTSAELWQANQQALARGAQPLEDFGNLMVGKTLGDIARQRHLEDIGSERQYEQTAAGAASKRRMAEQAESERLMTIRSLADQGVSVKSDMSMDDLAKAKRDFMTSRAGTQLEIIKSQMAGAQQRQQAAFDTIHKIASSPALGTKDQRLAALRTALNDSSAKLLPDDVRANLHSILDRGEDPAKAIDQAVQRMQAFWGSGATNIFKATRFSNATAFLQAYTGALQPMASETQKADLMAAFKALDDTNKEAQELNRQAYAHLGANAGLLPKRTVQEMMKSLAPPANPNDVMAAASKANDSLLTTDSPPVDKIEDEGPAPMITTPSPNPNQVGAAAAATAGMGPLPATIAALAQRPGVMSGAMTRVATAAPGALSALATGGVVPAVGAMGAPIVGAVGSGITSALRSLPASRIPPQGPQQLMIASPQEEVQARAVALMGLKRQGMSDTEATQWLDNEKAKALSGDPASIAGHNAFLRMIRSANSFPLGPNGSNGLALQGQPADQQTNAPALAPVTDSAQ